MWRSFIELERYLAVQKCLSNKFAPCQLDVVSTTRCEKPFPVRTNYQRFPTGCREPYLKCVTCFMFTLHINYQTVFRIDLETWYLWIGFVFDGCPVALPPVSLSSWASLTVWVRFLGAAFFVGGCVYMGCLFLKSTSTSRYTQKMVLSNSRYTKYVDTRASSSREHWSGSHYALCKL